MLYRCDCWIPDTSSDERAVQTHGKAMPNLRRLLVDGRFQLIKDTKINVLQLRYSTAPPPIGASLTPALKETHSMHVNMCFA